ncbi:hypothetical protein ACP70R_007549 [Stipagrostis hirtigluma subsp. patula]
MAAEGTSGNGSWKGYRERQDEGGRPSRATRGRKTAAMTQRRREAPCWMALQLLVGAQPAATEATAMPQGVLLCLV